MNRIKTLLPAIIWALIIFVLSTISGKQLPKIDLGWIQPDKLAHAGIYFIFAGLLFLGLNRIFLKKGKAIVWAFIICSFYGIGMELVQFLFFPGRFFEILDIIANISGSIGSLIIINIFFKDRNGK